MSARSFNLDVPGLPRRIVALPVRTPLVRPGDDMAAIVEIQLNHLRKLLEDRKIGLELDRSALEWLAAEGYDSTYGARPLKRVIQRSLQNPLAGLILEGTIKEGDTVHISAGADGLRINGQMAEAA